MASDNPWIKPPYYPPSEAPPSEPPFRDFYVRAGDKIWLDRTKFTIRPNKELSGESLEVMDVVEK